MKGSIEKSLIASLEPIVEMVVELRKSVETLSRDKGPQGEPGPSGAGIEAEAYVPGKVYRAGPVVTAFLGQYFKALVDTASEPGVSDHWGRIGEAGFRFTGPYDDTKTYQAGDLFIRDFGLFGQLGGEPRLLVGRGAKGEKGKEGEPGRPGRDGARIIAVGSTSGTKAFLLQEIGSETEQITLDFTEPFSKVLQLAAENLETALSSLQEFSNRLNALEKAMRRKERAGA